MLRDRFAPGGCRFTGDSFVLAIRHAGRGIPLRQSVNTDSANISLYRVGERTLRRGPLMSGLGFPQQLWRLGGGKLASDLGEPPSGKAGWTWRMS